MLNALRAFNKLASPDVLFTERYHRLDAAIGRELPIAFARINEISQRFSDAERS